LAIKIAKIEIDRGRKGQEVRKPVGWPLSFWIKRAMSFFGTFWTFRDVRLESEARLKAATA